MSKESGKGRSRGRERSGGGGGGRMKPQPGPSSQTSFISEIEERLPNISLSQASRGEYRFRPCKKPTQPGWDGYRIQLLANLYRLECSHGDVYQYDVTIEKVSRIDAGDESGAPKGPQRRSRKIVKRINRLVLDEAIKSSDIFSTSRLSSIVYDGEKVLLSSKKLKFKTLARISDLKVKEYPDYPYADEYVVTIQPSDPNIFSLATRDSQGNIPEYVILAINIITRHGPTSKPSTIPIGDKIFFSATQNYQRTALGSGKELSFGIYPSVRPCENGNLMLNIDRCATVFHCGGPLHRILSDILSDSKKDNRKDIRYLPRFSDFQRKQLSKELATLKVEVTHMKTYKRKHRIVDISRRSADDITFDWIQTDSSGQSKVDKISVADYFRKEYNCKLEYPNLPCIVVGSKERPKYLPIEVCYLLPDQYTTKKLAGEIQSAMTRKSSEQKPSGRFNEIENFSQELRKQSQPYLNEFNINIDKKLVNVEGRVLHPPNLQYANADFTPGSDGSWMMQKPVIKEFYNTVPLKTWIVVNMSSKIHEKFPESFAKKILQEAQKLGLVVVPPKALIRFSDLKKLKDGIFERASQKFKGLQLILFIIPKIDEYYYSIKSFGDKYFGIPTQCISDQNYNRDFKYNKLMQVSYITNVLLKINVKIGGTNTVLNLNEPAFLKTIRDKLMIVGIDVTHPAPGDRLNKSLASCVASYNPELSKYLVKIQVQVQTKKEIVQLHNMMGSILVEYHKKNNYFPSNIIIYRDGVSDGQFNDVLVNEVKNLLDFFATKDYHPKLTFIIVQKRHHTRFITKNPKDSTRSGNVPAGTIVDTTITSNSYFDFYIVSHSGLLGTSRPTHYYVLYDAIGFSPDVIQKLTYYMCYLFPRSTRGISIPAPVNFAHLAAFRARIHLYDELDSSDVGTTVDSEDSELQLDELKKLNMLIQINPNLNDTLYYI